MADIPFNIARGTIVEKVNDGATLIALLLETAETDADLRDYDTVSALLGGTSVEAAFDNYARQTLANLTVTVDDTTDSASLDADDITWTSAGGTTDETLDALVIYEDVDGTDANAVPLLKYDFAVTTDGTDLVAQIHTDGLVTYP